MEEGCAVAAGSSRSRAASTIRRFSSKNGGSFIAEENWLAAGSRSASRFGLPFGIERLVGKLAIGFLQEDFHAALGFFQLLLALAGERDALFEQLHRLVQRELRAFQAADDLFQANKGTLKVGFFRRFRFLWSR